MRNILRFTFKRAQPDYHQTISFSPRPRFGPRAQLQPNLQYSSSQAKYSWSGLALTFVAAFISVRIYRAIVPDKWVSVPVLLAPPEFDNDTHKPGRLLLIDNTTVDEDATKAQLPTPMLEYLKKKFKFAAPHFWWSTPPRSCPHPEIPLTTAESNKLFRDMRIQELTTRLGGDIDVKLLETEHARQWLEFFRQEGHNFGMVHAWASRYAAKPKMGSLWMHVLHGKERNPLHKSEPSDYNCALSNIRDGVEPYAACCYTTTDDHERVTWLARPLRIFPRRIWDLHSNRVIPFDWLVSHEARVGSSNVGFYNVRLQPCLV